MEMTADMQERYLEYIKAFRLFDDDFLKVVFENNPEATELVLNIILDRTDLKVQRVVGQREIKGIEGHSVRLDILAQDSEGKVYDIEIQRSDRGNLPLRARYNSSMMDTILLQEGQDYSKLVPTYVIFIVEKDAIGDSKPLHHYVTKDLDSNDILPDERHILFVNGDNKDEQTALGKLIHDFKASPHNAPRVITKKFASINCDEIAGHTLCMVKISAQFRGVNLKVSTDGVLCGDALGVQQQTRCIMMYWLSECVISRKTKEVIRKCAS